MALKEQDIRGFFHELAEWMSQRQLHADIIVDGGCATIFQNHYHEIASDIDFRISNITKDNYVTADYKEICRLQEDFFREYKSADKVDRD